MKYKTPKIIRIGISSTIQESLKDNVSKRKYRTDGINNNLTMMHGIPVVTLDGFDVDYMIETDQDVSHYRKEDMKTWTKI